VTNTANGQCNLPPLGFGSDTPITVNNVSLRCEADTTNHRLTLKNVTTDKTLSAGSLYGKRDDCGFCDRSATGTAFCGQGGQTIFDNPFNQPLGPGCSITLTEGGIASIPSCPAAQGCSGITYSLTLASPLSNTNVTVDINRANATSCYTGDHRWDNVGLLLDGVPQGLTITGNTTYRSTINSGAPGSHTLQFTVHNGECLCNTHTFTTISSAEAALPILTAHTPPAWKDDGFDFTAQIHKPRGFIVSSNNLSARFSAIIYDEEANYFTCESDQHEVSTTSAYINFSSNVSQGKCQNQNVGRKFGKNSNYVLELEYGSSSIGWGTCWFGQSRQCADSSSAKANPFRFANATARGGAGAFNTDLNDDGVTNSLDWVKLLTDWIAGKYTALEVSRFLQAWAGRK